MRKRIQLVQDGPLLRDMSKANIITLHEHTNKKVTGLFGGEHVARYIADGPRSFEFRGKQYITKYVSGCFFPFVYRIIA